MSVPLLTILGLLAVLCARIAADLSICQYTGQTLGVSTYYAQTVTSPNYPLNYTEAKDCSLVFRANVRFHVVKVIFNDFLLQAGTNEDCDRDKLKFYDGNSSYDNLIGRFCGKRHPEVVYSSGRNLYVRFFSDLSVEYRGFSFNASVVPAEKASGICRPGTVLSVNIRVTRSSGTIFTPNYPVPFKNGVQCDWIITVPTRKRVKLIFDAFQLSADSRCGRQTSQVVVRDGGRLTDSVIGTYCGSILPPSVQSSPFVNDLRVEFSARYQDQVYQGFKAHFKAIGDANLTDVCVPGNPNNNELRLEGSSGTLKSPLYPSSYPPNMTCTWVITVPDGKIVKLTFNYFQLEYERHCLDDYVEILDGKADTSDPKGKYCGLSEPDDIRSSDRYLRVYFRSDGDRLSLNQGFEATFQAVDKNTGLIIGIAVGIPIFICFIICSVCYTKQSMDAARRKRGPVTGTTAAPPESTPMIDILQPSPPQQQQ